MKKLIINIDDFGYNSNINQAVIDLFAAEKVTSASILVKRNAAGCQQALEFAGTFVEKSSFGLHLDLSGYFRFDVLQFWGRDENHIIENYREIFKHNIP